MIALAICCGGLYRLTVSGWTDAVDCILLYNNYCEDARALAVVACENAWLDWTADEAAIDKTF